MNNNNVLLTCKAIADHSNIADHSIRFPWRRFQLIASAVLLLFAPVLSPLNFLFARIINNTADAISSAPEKADAVISNVAMVGDSFASK